MLFEYKRDWMKNINFLTNFTSSFSIMISYVSKKPCFAATCKAVLLELLTIGLTNSVLSIRVLMMSDFGMA